jgi:integrase
MRACPSGSFAATLMSTPTRGNRSPCCARAAIGHAAAAPPKSVMNSRRLMFAPTLGRRHLTGLNEYPIGTGGGFVARVRPRGARLHAQYLQRKVRRWQAAARLIGVAPDSEGQLHVIPKSLSDRWRDRPVSGISADDLHWLVDEVRERGVPGLKRSGNRQSEAMAHQVFSVLRKLFRWLLEKRRIKSNPCTELIGPKATGNARDRYLSDSEIKKFWTACDKIDAPAGQCLKLLLLTGARLNEIALLSRAEIDGNTITIPAGRSKNRLPHSIQLPSLALEILRSVQTKGDLVFTGKSGKPLGPWSRIKKQLDKNMQPDSPFVLHDLRRTFSTGLNNAAAGKQLGSKRGPLALKTV